MSNSLNWDTPFSDIEWIYLFVTKFNFDFQNKIIELHIQERTLSGKSEEFMQKNNVAVPIIARQDSLSWKLIFNNVSSFKFLDESFLLSDNSLLSDNDQRNSASCYCLTNSKLFEELWITENNEHYPMKVYYLMTSDYAIEIMVDAESDTIIEKIKKDEDSTFNEDSTFRHYVKPRC